MDFSYNFVYELAQHQQKQYYNSINIKAKDLIFYSYKSQNTNIVLQLVLHINKETIVSSAET